MYLTVNGPDNGKASVKVTEFKTDELILAQSPVNYKLYKELYTDFVPAQISGKERAELDEICQNKTEFTYGEILYESFAPFLKLVDPQPGQIFYDIGCGGAKPLAIAALEYPELKECIGIEFLPNLASMAQQYMGIWKLWQRWSNLLILTKNYAQ